MKRYMIFAVVVVAILSLTLCVLARPATDQPADGRGQGTGQAGVRSEGGARRERGGDRRAMGTRGVRGSGRGAVVPVPETGFVQLFDGETLDGWEGSDRWKVEEGTIVLILWIECENVIVLV